VTRNLTPISFGKKPTRSARRTSGLVQTGLPESGQRDELGRFGRRDSGAQPPERDPRPAAEADVLPEVRRPMSVVPPRPGALSGMARRLTRREARRMAALRKTHGAGSGRPPGPKMPCGWKCGAKLTAAEMHGHFPGVRTGRQTPDFFQICVPKTAQFGAVCWYVLFLGVPKEIPTVDRVTPHAPFAGWNPERPFRLNSQTRAVRPCNRNEREKRTVRRQLNGAFESLALGCASCIRHGADEVVQISPGNPITKNVGKSATGIVITRSNRVVASGSCGNPETSTATAPLQLPEWLRHSSERW
jgi:hypothetical protein